MFFFTPKQENKLNLFNFKIEICVEKSFASTKIRNTDMVVGLYKTLLKDLIAIQKYAT
jgi:hypothetical protein